MWMIVVALVCFVAAGANYTETDWDYGDDRSVRRHRALGWLLVLVGLGFTIARLAS